MTKLPHSKTAINPKKPQYQLQKSNPSFKSKPILKHAPKCTQLSSNKSTTGHLKKFRYNKKLNLLHKSKTNLKIFLLKVTENKSSGLIEKVIVCWNTVTLIMKVF
jgi:hypothetical protein